MCIVPQRLKKFKKNLLCFFLLFSLNNHFFFPLSLWLLFSLLSSSIFFLSNSLANSLIPQLAGQLSHRRYVLLTQLADPPQAPSPISLSPITQFVPLSLSLSLSQARQLTPSPIADLARRSLQAPSTSPCLSLCCD